MGYITNKYVACVTGYVNFLIFYLQIKTFILMKYNLNTLY